jgi:hypothetical protein
MKKSCTEKITVFCFLVLLLFSAFSLEAQIRIVSPFNRSVFQRNGSNQATITITGNVNRNVDRIEANFEAIQGGQTTGWQTIATNPQGGVFSGSLVVNGGWYRLSVRGIVQSSAYGLASVDRVGVGEVFVVAGQSNSGSGDGGNPLRSNGAIPASDDRVNSVTIGAIGGIDGGSDNDFNYPLPEFRKLDGGNIAPRGTSPWCWGKLGDLLVARLNVPVLFMNAAWSGTSIRNWAESTTVGASTGSDYIAANYSPNTPYGHLRATLKNYCSYLGIRSILWMQGETDNYPGRSGSAGSGSLENTITAAEYEARLKTVINASRSDLGGANIPWVVARTSLVNWGYNCNDQRVSTKVIAGQNNAIASAGNTFAGPSTDNIQNPRPTSAQCVHISGTGLDQLATAWDAALPSSFFSGTSPISGSSPTISGSINCSNGQTTLAVQGGANFNWSTGNISASVTVNSGFYTVKVSNGIGGVTWFPNIEAASNAGAGKPSISSNTGNIVCGGTSATLTAINSANYNWKRNGASINQNSLSITTNITGNYTVENSSSFGCVNESDGFSLNTFSTPPPSKPTISASGGVSYCQGNSITLQSSYTGGNNIWESSGSSQRANSISTPNTNGIYYYIVRAVDNNGCTSENSNIVTITVFRNPDAPVIQSSQNVEICAGNSTALVSNYGTGNFWTNGANSQSISVDNTGTFQVRYTDGNGCTSSFSNPVNVAVNPLPDKPNISALTKTEICDKDSVILSSSPAYTYEWSNGRDSKQVTLKNAGTYSVRAISEKGCKSAQVSDNVTVTVNSLPDSPTITAGGVTTFCPDKNVALTASASPNGYVWSNNNKANSTSNTITKTITVNKGGKYTAQVTSLKGCLSAPSNSIEITVLPAPNQPAIFAYGPTNFCDGFSVDLKALPADPENTITKYSWQDEIEKKEIASTNFITIKKSGILSVKVFDNRGCFSESSTSTTINLYPLPKQPTVQVLRPKVFCNEDSTVFVSSVPTTSPNDNRNAYRWIKDGQTVLTTSNKNFTTKTPGIYAVETIDINGCRPLKTSDTLKVTVNSLPNVPVIVLKGANPFCSDKSITLTTNSEVGYLWSTGEKTSSITVKKEGNFNVKTINKFNCTSKVSANITTKTYQLPAISQIIAQGNTIFCDGDSVKLSSTSFLRTDWWKGTSSSDSLGVIAPDYFAQKAGNYYVQVTDGNGCRSGFSKPFTVDTKALPITPVIEQVGTFTLEAKGTGNSDGYEWKLGNNILAEKSRIVKSNRDGDYQVRASLTYSPVALPSGKITCVSKPSKVLNFKEDLSFEGMSVYPNPSTTGFLNIEVKDDLEGADLIVYNELGKIVYQYKIDSFSKRQTIDLRGETQAIFFVKVYHGIFEKVKKVFVVK